MNITLHHAPGACSRTPLILLEQAGADYALRIVRLASGENHTEDFRRLNPRGKVPVLVHDGRVLSENVAIAGYLARLFPQARLMPAAQDAWEQAQALSWLSWVASGVHPLIFRARMAGRVVEGEGAQASVKARALEALGEQLRTADKHLAENEWLAASHWTAPDAYLFWATGRAADSGLSLSDLPHLRAHAERMAAQPAVQRAIAREKSALETGAPA
ncbi:glutathione S-transferase family protein [Ramlibacter rhizophilus]|uniref:Glutathione S-transferase family protein n=1 Tax=Ramlibacter rhizophilus TaxID=1781167 RepID=A0A4Z0BPQ1_9BURK|nr:glutathione S-transferase N-terminal domain-containing protein [Ramlibacter rhizophilus]TFZ01277.1 glutathione S-transferase family protein [Ramlibacter rhizophilus]